MGIIYAGSAKRVVIDENGYREGRASPEILTLPAGDFEKSVENIRNKGKDVKDEYPRYPGEVYEMPDGKRLGIRQEEETTSGVETIDNMNREKESETKKWKKGKT